MHLHTLYSDGTASVQAVLDHVERETDLDLIAITDHERIDGAQRAAEIHAAGGYSFELVVGEEITTRRGHVLALFISERIPALRPLAETIERIHDQGGIAIAPHAMAPLTPSLGRGSLLQTHAVRGPPPSARRDRADEPVDRRPLAPRGAEADQRRACCGCRPSATRMLTSWRASAPRGRGSPARAATTIARRSPPRRPVRTGRTGRTSTTSTCTGASSAPRSATCGILCVPAESGGDIGPAVRGPDDRADRGAHAAAPQDRDRQPVRVPASRVASTSTCASRTRR